MVAGTDPQSWDSGAKADEVGATTTDSLATTIDSTTIGDATPDAGLAAIIDSKADADTTPDTAATDLENAAATDLEPPPSDIGGGATRPCSVVAQDCPARSACFATGIQAGQTDCFEGPCDLVAQDCGPGDMCLLVHDTGDGAPGRKCFPEGTATEEEACDGALSCVAGSVCRGTIQLCRRMCYTDDHCDDGKTCTGLALTSGTRARVQLCL